MNLLENQSHLEHRTKLKGIMERKKFIHIETFIYTIDYRYMDHKVFGRYNQAWSFVVFCAEDG